MKWRLIIAAISVSIGIASDMGCGVRLPGQAVQPIAAWDRGNNPWAWDGYAVAAIRNTAFQQITERVRSDDSQRVRDLIDKAIYEEFSKFSEGKRFGAFIIDKGSKASAEKQGRPHIDEPLPFVSDSDLHDASVRITRAAVGVIRPFLKSDEIAGAGNAIYATAYAEVGQYCQEVLK